MEKPESSYFTTRFEHDARREKLWHHLTNYLRRWVPPAAAVLELGAGYCYLVNNVPARRRVAVDLSPDMLLWKRPDVEGFCADAPGFLREAESEQFDFLLASNFFEHFDWPQLEEMLKH